MTDHTPGHKGPIHEAARRADVDALRRYLACGVSPNALGADGWTPLHYLCLRADRVETRVACISLVVRMLLEAGADINAPDERQFTPLHHAATWGHANVAAALIKAGADVNRGDANNVTPLHWACRNSLAPRLHGIIKSTLLLIRNSAAVDARDSSGSTPLDNAIENENRQFFPILLRAGAAFPAETDYAYLRKVIAAGGFRAYERTHLNALAATFSPKLPHCLPPELVRRVVEYAFHAGDY